MREESAPRRHIGKTGLVWPSQNRRSQVLVSIKVAHELVKQRQSLRGTQQQTNEVHLTGKAMAKLLRVATISGFSRSRVCGAPPRRLVRTNNVACLVCCHLSFFLRFSRALDREGHELLHIMLVKHFEGGRFRNIN